MPVLSQSKRPTKPKARALATFTVRHGTLCLKVRVLPSIRDVHLEYIKGGKQRANGKTIHAFFEPTTHPIAKHVGTVVLPLNGRLEELIPHEVTHAVIHALGGVLSHDDEACCTAVGVLSARIARKVGSSV